MVSFTRHFRDSALWTCDSALLSVTVLYVFYELTQSAIICSKLIIEAIEQGALKYLQN